LTRLGVGDLEVLECGADLLEVPTIVVKAVRKPKQSRRRGRR
ncbi:MAG: 16S rRNA (guanine(527)-N(7))-methyltransferase RsmG, partial [Rhodococcus sp.]|nr:16S rRNA (guanine(527)-N(7))-methyltransferase RsmG [Rhodococcus sp. (in: high G+C Gram-positive bacteria)]